VSGLFDAPPESRPKPRRDATPDAAAKMRVAPHEPAPAPWWWAGVAAALVARARADRAGGRPPSSPSGSVEPATPVRGERTGDENRGPRAACAVGARPASVAGERVGAKAGEGGRGGRRRWGSCRGGQSPHCDDVRIVDAAALGFDVPVHLRRRIGEGGSVKH
jgi:hypothetical protein